MKKILNKHMIILFALVVSILLMTTMYAAINSVTGDIQGKVIAEKQTGVYITDVQYVSDVNADLGVSTITNFKGTFMQNTVKLSNTNSASEIKYKVTVYNNSDKSYPFLAVLYDEEFYDNPNIIFEISAEGYKIGDIINPHETRDIFITFKYKDGQIPQNTTLNANLNFKIADPNRMVLAQDVPETGNYLGSAVVKNKIETIKFELGKVEPQGTISSFDVSEKQDGSIMGYYTDANNDGLYDLTFASNEPIYANVNASHLFGNLVNLKDISFNNFSTFNVENMRRMFRNCRKLPKLDVSKISTSYVIGSLGEMFAGCESIITLDLSKFDTRNVRDMGAMFYGCTSLNSIDLSGFDTSQVTAMNEMFAECSRLTNLDISRFNTSKVTNMHGMFGSCNEIKSLNLRNFNTSQVTSMGAMFAYCIKLVTVDVSNFNTSKVTDMSVMFYNCCELTSLDVSSFNTNQVTAMDGMFVNCSKLTELNVKNFCTDNVVVMQNLFHTCRQLKVLDISNFNTNKVTNMDAMFWDCTELQTIYVSEFNPATNTGWTTSNVKTSTHMFGESIKLVGGNGTKYDVNHKDKEYARIDRAGTPGYLTNIKDEYPPIAGTMTMKLDNANGAEYVNNTTTERNVYIAVNNGQDTAGGSGHKSTTYTVLKDGTTYLSNQTGTNTLTEIGTYTITVTTTDNAGNVATRGGYVVKLEKGKSPSQLFDQAGTNPDGLHIGDFVNYDAGTWTQEEINAIKVGPKSNLVTANGSAALPTQNYQFGGFKAGSSRNGNATPYTNNNTGNYVKDKTTNQPITGWRVFDVEGDNVTLISAGNPEDYYHRFGTDFAYISEYILTGNVNSSWTNGATEAGNYQKRDWSKYVNSNQKAESAKLLTKKRLDSWYTKFTNTVNADTYNATTFQKIYQAPYTKYQNMVDNYSYYWLSTAANTSCVYAIDIGPSRLYVSSEYGYFAFGIRILVTLSPDLKLTPQKIGTKTLTGGNMTKYGGDQTYNVWGIK